MTTDIRDIDVQKTWCLQGTLNFTRYSFKEKTGNKFIVGDHHRKISEVLDRVLKGEIKRLIINIAPRYGKTELAVKNFIAEGLAINPKSKFIHLSYSDDLVLDNSREIQEIICSDYYQRLFEIQLDTRNARKWYTKEGGGLYAVSTAGQVTGFGAGQVDPEKDIEQQLTDKWKKDTEDIEEFFPFADSNFAGAIVIDDPIKPEDALSDVVRERVNNRFETTIRNRVNSRNTPIIIIMQRLHEDDLCGYLIDLEGTVEDGGEWYVLSLPCIYTDSDTGEEKALWPHKHTLEELHKLEGKSSYVFDTQYMQNPMPIEGLMYKEFKTYEVIPHTKQKTKKNYTDTADTGKDYLCSICYDETEIGNFVTDILYTKKPMEYTEPKTTEMLAKNETEEANIESNNGGRGFARNVESQSRIIGNNKTFINWFHQSENKNVRIFTKSADVNNLTYFPIGWEKRWPEFARHIKKYRKEGGNAHDDAPDALTGTVEMRGVIIPSDIDKDDLGIF